MNEFCRVGPVQYLGHTGSKNTFCSLIKYWILYFTWKPSSKALLGLKSSSFCAFTRAHDIVQILYAFILCLHMNSLSALHLCLTWLSICCIKLLNKKGNTHTMREHWWSQVLRGAIWTREKGFDPGCGPEGCDVSSFELGGRREAGQTR